MIRSKTLLFALLLSVAGLAQTPVEKINRLDHTTITTRELTKRIKELMDSTRVTGLGIAIFNQGEPVYMNTFGYANYPAKTPLTPQTIGYGASFSKAVLAYVVMQFVDEKRLDLDKPLVGYLTKPLPDYSIPGWNRGYKDLSTDRRYEQLTARMCLTHTTGFPNWRWFEPDKKIKFKFSPGTRYSYSGEGIYLLQFVLEQITGQDYETMAQERVFIPLGMANTSYVWQDRFQENLALGHSAAGKPYDFFHWKEASGAGSLCTTLADYSRFFGLLMQKKGLSSTAYQAMVSPQVRIRSRQQFGPGSLVDSTDNDAIELSYGLGLGVLKSPQGWAFFKEGHDEGWGHYCIGFPQAGIGVVLMTNSDQGEHLFRDLLATSIADIYTPWYWEDYIPYSAQK